MKLKRIFLFQFLFIILLISVPVFAEEKINNYDVSIKINPDASILVTENINYDFGATERHGIFRDIPVKYNTLIGNKSIKLKIQSVIRDKIAEKYVISNNGFIKNIKIGDQDITISGEHLYTITYKVLGAIGYFENFDELYWNITGNNWPVKIENTSTKIEFSGNVDLSKIQNSCYLGFFGSTEKCELKIENNSVISNNIRPLKIGEGLTIAIGFSKNIVYQPNKFENFISLIKDNFILLLPFFVFIIMFVIWRINGKDPKGLSTIIAEYEPPKNLTPTLIGSLMRERVNFVDIIAGLIFLAEQGYLNIKKLKVGGYEFELLENNISELEKIEIGILNLFFKNDLTIGRTIKVFNLKNNKKFIKDINNLTEDIYKELIYRKFYKKNPLKTSAPYLLITIILAFIGPFIIPLGGIVGLVSLEISGLIILIFGLFMSKKTKLGSETRDHIKGFKLFLSVTEKDRLKFHNAPEKKPEQFMKFLPYAIALGIENEWSKQFEEIDISKPNWYQGNITSFNANNFVSNLLSLSGSLSAMAGGSGSGGGGSSGGGGGGGGGGSW